MRRPQVKNHLCSLFLRCDFLERKKLQIPRFLLVRAVGIFSFFHSENHRLVMKIRRSAFLPGASIFVHIKLRQKYHRLDTMARRLATKAGGSWLGPTNLG
jgi:hypothetical protein